MNEAGFCALRFRSGSVLGGRTRITVVDPGGRIIWEETVDGAGDDIAAPPPVRGLAPGVYLVRVSTGVGSAHSRFVVLR